MDHEMDATVVLVLAQALIPLVKLIGVQDTRHPMMKKRTGKANKTSFSSLLVLLDR
jgi:hypothetical protein